ncbi:hypothetical protein FNV43_RR15171 [Rhamnella rubrinervis]|uniref:Protein kinase domain-containing protein n=1 Tax=Rhamnella rubrinervis TaxID=2594499 RepID=A0A8K0E797_9ROSA|nr:hypothetical protein FNV43_RR15171 [Rhamnella rubrinervis]
MSSSMLHESEITAGCKSSCSTRHNNRSCNGVNCGQTNIPSNVQAFTPAVQTRDDTCKYSFLADRKWFMSNSTDFVAIYDMDYVPVTLKWNLNYSLSPRLVGGISGGIEEWGESDINECEINYSPNGPLCERGTTCVNTIGSYNCRRPKFRIILIGGQGTVYKGMLVDGKIVAVKKSKIVDEGNVSEFVNEIVILSQINHRNVVRVRGCCLETKVPLLVYEYIPNGALFYLHSAASFPIYHRDIKSSNILLDEKYRAKVDDFGTSRSISINKHINQYVLQEEKKKPSLATYFIVCMEENCLVDIVDARIVKDGQGNDEIVAVANRCLNLNGKFRPTMREIAMELEAIQKSGKTCSTEENHKQVELLRLEVTEPRDVPTSSIGSNPCTGSSSSLDVSPLLSFN